MAQDLLARQVSRRDFNAASLTALFVGMSVWVGACGGSSGGGASAVSAPSPTTGASPAPTPAAPAASDHVGAISANHGHAATVTGVQLQSGGSVSLHIQGAATHDHLVELSADDVKQIAAGARVSAGSSSYGGSDDGYGNMTPGHSHTVTFN
jgi:hypothetical protein